ncbi:aconitate hydratase [Ornatilinea apprima]|uniref:Aconitate hydratase n=1 Tax=Ornatilinea apprima TaxID=1134406 RepID=A0A0P6Y6X5_9CHLR|nr:aconitate hydratase AcnA [Ornatilinea apprima]KPL77333.1 aconitate hydratase [Ornatilinea apprima]
MNQDFSSAKTTLTTPSGSYVYYRLGFLEEQGLAKLASLPFSIRVMLEGALRACNGREITREDVVNLAQWTPTAAERPVMPFSPGRVVMQDFTGVPVLVDLAAMRSALQRMGGNPMKINPVVPVDVVIDHSVQVDAYGVENAAAINAELEFKRNRERYEFLHWGQNAFDNLRVVPPATGIIHQVNLEYLTPVVLTKAHGAETLAYPDTIVGTDSHTTMINGLGVAGWGVGGIEAVAAMLGQPIEMVTPDVIGFKLSGKLPAGATPTDLTLTITQILRKKGVVGKFIEYFGPGLDALSLADRAMIANMTPEYGATMSYFPVDELTLAYLRLTGRAEAQVELVEAYFKAQGLFRENGAPDPQYSEVIELDLNSVEPSLAGPKRPQDRVTLREVKTNFYASLQKPKAERGYGLDSQELESKATLSMQGEDFELRHGAVVLAAITSCTNTSNPFVMLGAGLLARKAVARGLRVKPYVKTSLAPGSRVVTDYLVKAGLMDGLEALGFTVVGYGCTTCIGNSGPLPEDVVRVIKDNHLVAAAVLSGNRNFEGRVSPHTLANYLASPPLVVAYALAGRMDIDFDSEAIGAGSDGRPVYLKDLWPTPEEIYQLIDASVTPELFRQRYAEVFAGNEAWNALGAGNGKIYTWDEASTYIQEPPYFENLTRSGNMAAPIKNARVLALLGDSITTDHISPAGSIPSQSPAGKYLQSLGVDGTDFNSYGSRRGNDRVMTRGTFGNIRLKNLMVPGTEGGYAMHLPSGEISSLYETAMRYQSEGTALLVLAGKEYGTGSSRDWAAKGTMLLGIKAVIAESYERIHRSNLIGMGVLPLQFKQGENAHSLGLDGSETYEIEDLTERLELGQEVQVRAARPDGSHVQFTVIARIDTRNELRYYRNGGLLHTILRDYLQ